MKVSLLSLVISEITALLIVTATAEVPDCSADIAFIAHPTDCTRYFACSNGVAILRKCPTNLWWNPNLNVCDWPADSGCTATCSGDVDFIPHPTECNLYYVCSGGEAILRECSQDRWWSPSSKKCDWPSYSGCTAMCSSGETFFPHPTHCGQYFTCIGGESFLNTCPEKFWWNPNLNTCDLPSDSGCKAICWSGAPAFVPHPTDCNLYFTCIHGEPLLSKCPEYFWYSSSFRKCVWSSDSGCNAECNSTTAYFAHPTDCNSYFWCRYGRGNLQKCQGTWWNDNLKACDLPSESGSTSKCSSASVFPHPSDCTRYFACNANGEAIMKECPDDLFWNPELNACDFPSDSGCTATCSSGGPYVPHPTDCTRYFTCNANGEAIMKQCPDYLWWNPNKNECDWPSDSGCTAGSAMFTN